MVQSVEIEIANRSKRKLDSHAITTNTAAAPSLVHGVYFAT